MVWIYTGITKAVKVNRAKDAFTVRICMCLQFVYVCAYVLVNLVRIPIPNHPIRAIIKAFEGQGPHNLWTRQRCLEKAQSYKQEPIHTLAVLRAHARTFPSKPSERKTSLSLPSREGDCTARDLLGWSRASLYITRIIPIQQVLTLTIALE